MQQGLKEVIQAAPRAGLLGFQPADFCHAVGKLLLQ